MKNNKNNNQEYINENFDKKTNDKKVRGLWFFADLKKMYRMLKDKNVPWYLKASIITALAYFISPVDAIPDIAPIVGYLDDAGVIASVVAILKSELDNYDDYDNNEKNEKNENNDNV